MNNGVNETNNQSIPGVKVAMPDAAPVDASTADAGAALSNAVRINEQPSQPVMASVVPVASAPTPVVPVAQQTVQPVASVPAAPVMQVQTPVIQPVPSVQATVQPTMQTVAPAAVMTNVVTENPTEVDNGKKKKNKKPKNKLARFFFFIIILLCAGCAGLWFYHQQQMAMMRYKCTPVSTSGETKELDLNSTIVKDLYGKVATTIREDIANNELNDDMKLYLAFRQIATKDMYESNCNKFSTTSMEPFTCEVKATFVPKAFKSSVLQTEVKKLFGDDTNIANKNIQLGKGCIGGYQYIPERDEYVQGQCGSQGATLYKVDKELIGATSTESTIVLTEKVKYYGTEAIDLPTKLVSGTYKYTFRLDMNYNYIYVSKELAS